MLKKKKIKTTKINFSLHLKALHAGVMFLHFLTLSVATNSNNNMLFTLLVSNNFIEIKVRIFYKNGKLQFNLYSILREEYLNE